jgi:DNA repair protein RadC
VSAPLNLVHGPQEKLITRGPEALSEAELISLVLRVGLEDAAALLGAFPEGFCADFVRLKKAPGLGVRKAAALAAAAELGKRQKLDMRPIIDNARAVVGLVSGEVRMAAKEHFLIFCLNARRQLVHQETVSVGTLSASLVHPREVFSPAITRGAAAVVALHNHPSGDPAPSAEDREVTRRLQRAGELLGIPLADHVVISESSYFSFREHGLL